MLTHGSEELKQLYAPKMIEGRWTGTMNLTEPHCGTDLGLLKTRASRRDDGSYAITGQKIFISAGEHDLTENIVHLVLARIEGAPAGIKGISLFVVPKFLPDADGTIRARATPSSCGSIEHKMGIHGNSTCVMNYDGATGWLVGEANRGLQRDVRDDERGAARRRRAGPGAVGSRLSERRRLCQASVSQGARSDRREISAASRPIRSSSIPTCAACC